MGFSQFKSEIEVARRFNLRTDSKPFVQTLPLENIPEYKLEEIKENFKDPLRDDNDEPSNLQKLFDSLNWLFEKAIQVEIIPFRSP
ncbi:hypothetical protein KKHLCK_04100 [Candidatus Electrothrix laxa]